MTLKPSWWREEGGLPWQRRQGKGKYAVGWHKRGPEDGEDTGHKERTHTRIWGPAADGEEGPRKALVLT